MNWPKFCVNEQAFSGIGAGGQRFTEKLEDFVDLIEHVVIEKGYSVEIPSAVYGVKVDNAGTELVSVLYAPAVSTNRDLLKRLMLVIARCKNVDIEIGAEIPATTVGGAWGAVTCRGIALSYIAHASVSEGWYFAILSRGEDGLQEGEVSLNCEGSVAQSYVVISEKVVPLIFRTAIKLLGVRESEFFQYAVHAFPKLIFHPDLTFRKFSNGYVGCCDTVCSHLGFLNDHFLKLAADLNWDHAAMMAHAPVSFSDESGNTKSNRAAMRQREIVLTGKTVTCTLHTKLEPTKNRIHFHPPRNDIDPAKIIVGIFAEHLGT